MNRVLYLPSNAVGGAVCDPQLFEILAIAKFSLKLGILLYNRHPNPLQQSYFN